jgi:hypothetical protein
MTNEKPRHGANVAVSIHLLSARKVGSQWELDRALLPR